jgi:hypothetical protein
MPTNTTNINLSRIERGRAIVWPYVTPSVGAALLFGDTAMKSKADRSIAAQAQSAAARSVTVHVEIPTAIQEWLRRVGKMRGLTMEGALAVVLHDRRMH